MEVRFSSHPTNLFSLDLRFTPCTSSVSPPNRLITMSQLGIATIFDFAVDKRPLTFDRVNDNRAPTSLFPLFQLPIELYNGVAPYLDPADLKAAALVDRDCRQWARSIQFSDVRIDSSTAATELLLHLQEEGRQRIASKPSGPRIGSCVRRLVIATDHDLVNNVSAEPTAFHPDSSVLAMLYDTVRYALPNLCALDWQASTVLSPQMLDKLAVSSIIHLRLGSITMGGSWASDAEPFVCPTWPLETLMIGIHQIGDQIEMENITSFLQSIFSSVSPTMRHLKLYSASIGSELEKRFFDNLPRRLNLRTLEVDGFDFEDLPTLLEADIRIRSLSLHDPFIGSPDLVRDGGHMPSLERLRWLNYNLTSDDRFSSFLRVNPQLRYLSASEALNPTFLEEDILPLLVSNFTNLTHLCLIWDDTQISEESLTLISTIGGLRNLWLSAGQQTGCRHNWDIDHDLIRDKLAPLQGLEMLAFSRDSYHVNAHPLVDPALENYYQNKALPREVKFIQFLTEDERRRGFEGSYQLRLELQGKAWEMWHRKEMEAFGARYALAFGKLEWCHIGQLPMVVGGDRDPRCAVVESVKRDPELMHLKRRWGI